MIKKDISVHLQDFPNLNFVKDNDELVKNMDLVRSVCSAALSIRDNKNLRVRLPLNKLSVIGKDAAKILEFKDVIADEVNVKNIEIEEGLEGLAELKLAINFKKIGAKMGPKIKDIMAATKSGDWKQISEDEIEIAGEVLRGDDFSLKLTPKNFDDKNVAIHALSDNSHLISLDIVVTEELKNEGLARDIVRMVQQARKDADLDVSDRIELSIKSDDVNVGKILSDFDDYIKEQVLANKISFNKDLNSDFVSKGKAEGIDIEIGINK